MVSRLNGLCGCTNLTLMTTYAFRLKFPQCGWEMTVHNKLLYLSIQQNNTCNSLICIHVHETQNGNWYLLMRVQQRFRSACTSESWLDTLYVSFHNVEFKHYSLICHGVMTRLSNKRKNGNHFGIVVLLYCRISILRSPLMWTTNRVEPILHLG